MALTITMVKTSDLIPYEKNPRKNDKGVDAVANSIKAYGFKVPIVISSDNVVVTGHTRLKAAKKLGLEEVPCIIADDLSEEQIRQFRIVDNKTAELSDWDFDLLREELLALDEVDMVQFGFDDLDAILQTETKDDDFDFDEELPENPYSKRGDVYVLGEHRVMCGDSTLKEDVDILMNGRVADLIETDPPYNVAIGTKGKQYKERGGYNTGMTDRTILNDDMDDTSFREFLKR